MSAKYIRFPCDVVDQTNNEAQFAAITDFPNVFRADDHNRINVKVACEEFASVNRKHLP